MDGSLYELEQEYCTEKDGKVGDDYMIDWDKYDPAKDADEDENHLCNSLNATYGSLYHYIYRHKEYAIVPTKMIEIACEYLERSQATITYLRKKLEEKENKQ